MNLSKFEQYQDLYADKYPGIIEVELYSWAMVLRGFVVSRTRYEEKGSKRVIRGEELDYRFSNASIIGIRVERKERKIGDPLFYVTGNITDTHIELYNTRSTVMPLVTVRREVFADTFEYSEQELTDRGITYTRDGKVIIE